MPAERYYCPIPFQVGDHFTLKDEEAHHVARVMRGRPGDKVEVVNGRGMLGLAEIFNMAKAQVDFTLLSILKEEPPPLPVIIAQALPKLNRIDVIVEKGTELGMTQLWFYPGDLSEKKEISPTQEIRFNSLAIAAMKQCGCLWLPKIAILPPLEEWSSLPCSGIYGDVDPKAKTLKEVWPTISSEQGLIFFVGPEKGFSSAETAHLNSLGARGVSLHPNILRTDTAPLCALSQIVLLSQRQLSVDK